MFDERLFQSWVLLLQGWACDGQLLSAAIRSLNLSADNPPQQLKSLISRLSEGDLSDLPAIKLLKAEDMPGIAGAYITNTIYLNRTWLRSASEGIVVNVLTEEFGHHLDRLFNAKDTHGDEGKLFTYILTSNNGLKEKKSAIRSSAF